CWCATGVAILVKRGVIENVRKCVDDGEGRMIGISFEHNGGKYKLINFYALNEERKFFFERAGEMCDDNCMIVWDSVQSHCNKRSHGAGGWWCLNGEISNKINRIPKKETSLKLPKYHTRQKTQSRNELLTSTLLGRLLTFRKPWYLGRKLRPAHKNKQGTTKRALSI
uniref:Uncharacterized protein n=1 Tax=Gasterosteus aculeatus aculeatus TaxID=481459 RepID=A0AAQ4PFQ3_GASAC